MICHRVPDIYFWLGASGDQRCEQRVCKLLCSPAQIIIPYSVTVPLCRRRDWTSRIDQPSARRMTISSLLGRVVTPTPPVSRFEFSGPSLPADPVLVHYVDGGAYTHGHGG